MRSRSRAWWPICAVTIVSLVSIHSTIGGLAAGAPVGSAPTTPPTTASPTGPAPARPMADADADKKKRQSIKDCTSFDQVDRTDDDAVDLTVSNRCEATLACSIRWQLVCAPGTRKAKRSKHASTFELAPDASETATASAAACGFEGWEISEISWSCDLPQ
jgi:hypothetical protein